MRKGKKGLQPQATCFHIHKVPVTVQFWNKPMVFELLLTAEFTNFKYTLYFWLWAKLGSP